MARTTKKKTRSADSNPMVNTELIGKLSETSSSSERVSALGWFNLQGEENKLVVIKKHGELILQNRIPGTTISPELSYSMLVLAAKICRRDEEALAQKKRVKVEEANEIARKRIDGFQREKKKKSAPKAEQIRGYLFGIITVLREQNNFSWQDVSAYLQRYHNLVVTRAYVQQHYDAAKKEVASHDEL